LFSPWVLLVPPLVGGMLALPLLLVSSAPALPGAVRVAGERASLPGTLPVSL
jgi:hypothetical protein